ncbi:uncharacterized protein MKK02DRAFT_40632 [Dioszegia hungarica]|uniref:Right handed beta helix domain-containing protein n=1 Tax=Dioszegia hungarica TaxID=4972 RepID=A0AA38H3W0_9TREE|nr:uncharacterized protein MKK02DRAFT_40632 [Dioszegia hungarica]KAI9632329.1 hypothetical protein MKK02DRAFT_40632 [Dioszegia hungarica]
MSRSGTTNGEGASSAEHCFARRKRRRVDGPRDSSSSPSAVAEASTAAAARPSLAPLADKSSHPRPLLSTHRHRSLLPTLIFTLAFILLLSVPVDAAAASCLRFADYDSITALFTEGGPGTVVQLCPSKIYRLSGPIVFTAADQEITTFGNPTDDTRAVLRIQASGETAIQGDCRRCKGVKVRNLIIDGYRWKLGRSKPDEAAGPLVVLGGNEGQVVENCVLRDPRGFTAIHVREGDKLECKGARITGNVIGPVGEEYDSKKDGEDPELSPLGKPLADGLSIACRDSLVKDNVFIDNTAASIVLYCSPGTVVENNTIYTDKKSAMAGILMVDATPFNADYTGVVVRDNIVHARGAGLRVGIGIGPTVWSDDTETILTGGSVLHNRLEGSHMGYGIAAAGLKGWKILDNVDGASYEGRRGERCFPEAINPDPMAFMYTSKSITESEVQAHFVDADFQYAACLDPVEAQTRRQARKAAMAKHAQPQKPVAAAHPPKTPPPPGKTVPDADVQAGVRHPPAKLEEFDTGSEMMDGILEHSRSRVVEEIERLNQRMESLFQAVPGGGEHKVPVKEIKQAQVPGQGAMGLQKRVEALEQDQGKLVEEATGLRRGMQKWNQEMSKVHAWEHELLLDIQSRIHHHFLTHPEDNTEVTPGEHHDDHSGHEANQAILNVPHESAGRESRERETLRQKSERARLLAAAGGGERGWTRWAVIMALIGLAVGGWRWRSKGRRSRAPVVLVSAQGATLGPGSGFGGMGMGTARGMQIGGGLGGGGGAEWRPWAWRGSHRKVT